MYEAALSQIHALASSPPSHSSDTLAKASVFWYAYSHEGMSSGLRGCRLLLLVSLFFLSSQYSQLYSDEDDLDNFQRLYVSGSGDLAPFLPSTASPMFSSPNSPLMLFTTHQQQQQHNTPPQLSYAPTLATRYLFDRPLILSGVCRKVHAVLTGRRAQANNRAGVVMEGLEDIWVRLGACWGEFEALGSGGGIGQAEGVMERYAAGWQVRFHPDFLSKSRI